MLFQFIYICTNYFCYMDFKILPKNNWWFNRQNRDFAQNNVYRGDRKGWKADFSKRTGWKICPTSAFWNDGRKPEYGGAGMDTVSYVLAMEEISKVDASTAVVMSVNNSLVLLRLAGIWHRRTKAEIPDAIGAGQKRMVSFTSAPLCWASPKPVAMPPTQRTIAEDKGDHYLFNGTKNWITNGGTACVFSNKQTDAPKGNRGINTLIVEKNWRELQWPKRRIN